MSITSQERQTLEGEFSSKAVDEAVVLVQKHDQASERKLEPKLNKDDYRALIQLWFT